MNKNWFGLMKIIDFQHIRNGEIVYQEKDLYNVLHTDGEEFLLSALFTGGQDNSFIPDSYYLGLDNRTTVSASDEIGDLSGEPSTNGYTRQALSSTTGFTVALSNGVNRATSNIVSFNATGGSWGPVRSLFLSDKVNNTGTLISSVLLSSATTVQNGDSVNLRMALSLRDCPS